MFRDELGTSPARYVEGVRMEAARRDLETTDRSLTAIAETCGFGSAETLRRAFHRHLGITPDAYRQRFRMA